MNPLAQYVLSVCCCALIGGILLSFAPKGAAGQLQKLIIGIFVSFSLISPLRELELKAAIRLPEDLYREGVSIASAARTDSRHEIANIIMDQAGAYILEEAKRLNVNIQIESITLDEDTLKPEGVAISGSVSPYDRTMLAGYIETTLGIGKEAQVWNCQVRTVP